MEGFNLSKRKDGYYYIFYFDETGKRKGKSTGAKIKSEALAFLSKFKESIQVSSVTNLKPAIDLFLNYSKAIHVKRHTQNYKAKLKRFYDYFGNAQLSKVTTPFIQSYINGITAESKTLANKSLTLIKAFFNFAVSQELISVNPCNRIKKFKLPEKQPLYFKETELIIVLSYIQNQDLRDMVIFAVNTGMRLSELINLRFDQIDLERETVILNNQTSITKSKKVRTIPLNTSAKTVILKRAVNNSEYVFTHNNEKFKISYASHEFKKAVRKAGLNDAFHFHSLRHTFASYLVIKNIPIFSVSKLLGHSNVNTTMIYSHLAPEQMQKEVETISINLN